MEIMKLTQTAWNHIHPDFKGETDGQKFRMWADAKNHSTVAVEIVKDYDFKQGDRVRCNGFDGAVVRRYSKGMYEVSVPGGVVCVSASELISLA